MKIAIIGYGKEGKANEAYFREHRDERGRKNEITVIDPYRDEDYEKYRFSQYDLVLRSPSVRPRPGFSSATQYFFDHCPAPIIGVTGTKGKGTTCSMITKLLEALGKKVFLVGNIGVPAIEKLDEIRAAVEKEGEESAGAVGKSESNCVVVYEMSSFQLWDLTKSPHVAVVLRIAPDHLNVHRDFEEYVAAKGHIAEFQDRGDKIVYFRDGERRGAAQAREKGEESEELSAGAGKSVESREIAKKSAGEKISFPVERGDEAGAAERLDELLDNLTVPGAHNREDAEAAVLTVAAFLGVSLEELLAEHFEELARALSEFKGLPHHIEFVRELNGVSYYDDSFSTAAPALEVALQAFSGRPLVLIAGGQDKGIDLTEIKQAIFGFAGLEKVLLIGEIAEKLAEGEEAEKFEIVSSLEEAVGGAQKIAEKATDKIVGETTDKIAGETTRGNGGAVVLLSPGAASLDMFESYYARGDEFQRLVKRLK